ncbi:Pentulose kinase, partial [Aureobasidium melanogenum]
LPAGRLVVWDEHIAVWSPDTLNEHRILRHGQMAGRSSSNGSQTGEGLRYVVLVGTRLKVGVWQANLGSDSTNPTSIGIDDTSTDSDTSRKTKVSSSLLAKSANLVTSIKILETNLLEEVLLPTLDTAVDTNRHEALLADNTAEATVVVAGGNVSKSIGQVVESAAVEQLLGHVVLEPQNLWHLHLNAHLSTNVAEQVVNYVAVVAIGIVELGACDGNGLVGVVGEDGKRAGGVETDTADGGAINAVHEHCRYRHRCRCSDPELGEARCEGQQTSVSTAVEKPACKAGGMAWKSWTENGLRSSSCSSQQHIDQQELQQPTQIMAEGSFPNWIDGDVENVRVQFLPDSVLGPLSSGHVCQDIKLQVEHP